MVKPGDRLELTIEKPAAGGRMIARHEGQVVFVLGAIPGERVVAAIERSERQLAFATTEQVLEPSPDRRAAQEDPLCGGCLYSHIAYPAQVRVKAALVDDAFRRLGRIVPPPFAVEPSEESGYRMRARLHVEGSAIGFFREGTHTVCDAAPTRQLSAAALACGTAAATRLARDGAPAATVEISENLAGTERALHVEFQPGARADGTLLDRLSTDLGLTGCTARAGYVHLETGTPEVSDPLAALTNGRASSGVLGRRPQSFFQANRYLLPTLVSDVISALPNGPVLDLYAGVGLFAVSLAASGRDAVTAVEGSASSSQDLQRNAAPFAERIRVVRGSVETYLRSPAAGHEAVIVDPPRTGISRAAMEAVVRYGAGTVAYVSCDPATMARDARRLLDGGYTFDSLRAYDLFPNTPHVESLGVFTRR